MRLQLTVPLLGVYEAEYVRDIIHPYKGDEMLSEYAFTANGQRMGALIEKGGKIVFIGAAEGFLTHAINGTIKPEDRKPVSDLRNLAEQAIAQFIPDFYDIKANFHPLEDNLRRNAYFFRWDDFSKPVAETDIPPFVQICLTADGKFASYTNNLR